MQSHLASATVGVLLGSAVRDAVEPVITFVGGTAAVVSAASCVLEWSKDDPQWDRAMGHGAVAGALIGAGLLLVDAAS
jgi:hypothetical protein